LRLCDRAIDVHHGKLFRTAEFVDLAAENIGLLERTDGGFGHVVDIDRLQFGIRSENGQHRQVRNQTCKHVDELVVLAEHDAGAKDRRFRKSRENLLFA